VTIITDDEAERLGALWVDRRTKPEGKRAEVGWVGTVANCLGGDEVWIYTKDDDRYKATISWANKDGSAMVRLSGGRGWQSLQRVSAETKVQWRKVRPK